ncbi:DegT/DnrJ/EryC1/StrS family aminotransferase [Pectobacterium sp. A5351]|uniref:DegT/DnrJ/EryC1/StrS family aminotransferase n=1 Tax=Pectobacterium sp. A5351 TaxID=2914983 RepID=UPI00232D49DC|nr:DegT/DnrJ/EryC1/StrS family aminotransferase [Pectobacterium sp. A5351]WCG81858.1 DegT/DnrJ/EryC1/StrS family aminotransferase [Pectobacterium sp. A5351]
MKNIFVTSPLLPPLEEFVPYLEQIWDNKWLTNNGPFHQQLEKKLAEHLGVEHLCLFSNGTLALLTALQALRITGEVITTPYSFVATSHSLLWNGLKPVFVDIDPITCNLDPERIERAITPATSAILPVHCYGIPANVDRIQEIADTYGLKVIYDAAHAFDVKQKGTSILNHGDLSILSFHATKVFNTIEGGAIICPDAKTKKRIDYLKNFGFADEVTVMAPGINGKMNEVQAAFGMLQLQHIDHALEQRRRIYQRYSDALQNLPGIGLINVPQGIDWNYAYYPIFIGKDFPCTRDELYSLLKEVNIFSRRYFYPLISSFPMYRGLDSASQDNLPVAQSVADVVLCLPIYADLLPEDQERVIMAILAQSNASMVSTAEHQEGTSI